MANAVIDKNEIVEKDVEELILSADVLINNTIRNINTQLMELYWNIGKMIVEYRRKNDFQYGEAVINRFSKELGIKYGKGFDYSNITRMIKFYKIFSNVAPEQYFIKVNWSHIKEMLRISDFKQIEYYLKEIEDKKLTKNELASLIKSKGYERTISNQRKSKLKNELEKTLKDPIVLNIDNKKRSEKELEKEILNNISNFKREIGNHVMFFESQYKVNINGLTHKVDLVFFDNEINSYILVDLKINKVTNRDVFQMQMYIDYFNKYMKQGKFNKTIGIILCETKDARVETNNEIYQVKYLSEIPKDKELLKIINENKIILLKTEHLKIESKDCIAK
ncbi:MAG: PDDEXK nuclease domain-containing protein [Oscillospiraceae bacterium]|nr:PDDEXK nuclease domain-containing protein [Oscillospiraceae bacterium]